MTHLPHRLEQKLVVACFLELCERLVLALPDFRYLAGVVQLYVHPELSLNIRLYLLLGQAGVQVLAWGVVSAKNCGTAVWALGLSFSSHNATWKWNLVAQVPHGITVTLSDSVDTIYEFCNRAPILIAGAHGAFDRKTFTNGVVYFAVR